MKIEVFQLFVEISILLIGLYLALFKSYFTEKGKNIATKEDIEEITSKVEKIKNDLNYLTQSKLSVRGEARVAIVEYFTKLNYWLNSISSSDISSIDEESNSGLEEIRARIYSAKFEFDLARSKLEIYIQNPELAEIEAKVMVGTLEFQHILEKALMDLKKLHFEISLTKSQKDKSLVLNKYSEDLERKTNLTQQFYSLKIEKYKSLVAEYQNMRKIIYKQIEALVEG